MIDSLSSGERTGNSLNPYMCKRCSVAVWGLRDLLSCGAARMGHASDERGTGLESRAREGNSPVDKTYTGCTKETPEYNGTRGTLLESARTTSQG